MLGIHWALIYAAMLDLTRKQSLGFQKSFLIVILSVPIRTLINRITGLDPAGASYGLTETEVRLDQTGN